MSEIRVHMRIQVIRITILILMLIIMSVTADVSAAADLEFGFEGVAIASDNIDRGPVGEATDGYLLSLDGSFTISESWGAARAGLTIGGGLENKQADVTSNSNNYHIQLTGTVPWSGTGYVEGSTLTSEGIGEPDLTDISQVRVRSKTSETSITVGRRPSSTVHWYTGLSQETEERYDRDFDELQAQLGWETALDNRSTMIVTAEFIDGTEKIEGDDWTGSSALIDLRKRTSGTSLRGYQLAWEEISLDQEDGTHKESDKFSLLVHYEMETVKKWSFSSDIGVDVINPPAGERRWEPHASMDFASDKEKRVQVVTSLSSISSIQDPTEDQYAWTRNSQGRAALVWKVTRKIVAEPSVRVLNSELAGIGVVDRKDRAVVLGLETSWTPYRDWSFMLNVYNEERTSSDRTFDLSENRIELRASGLIN